MAIGNPDFFRDRKRAQNEMMNWSSDTIGISKKYSGRTTSQALRIIADAMSDSTAWVLIKDHQGTKEADLKLTEQIFSVIELLGLKGLVYSKEKSSLRFDLLQLHLDDKGVFKIGG